MIMPVLTVSDYDASAAFYEKLGFNCGDALKGPDGSNIFGIALMGDDTMIGLSRLDMNAVAPGQPCGVGVDIMVYLPDAIDLDQLYTQVQERGVVIDEAIGDRFWGDRTFTVIDPDGYRIVLCKTISVMSMEDINQQMLSVDQG